jgi:hypothetical protein
MENKKITFEDIQKANETIKTTDIKGKEYAEVNQRIKAFRMVYPDGVIKTNMKSNENGVCIFEANIYEYYIQEMGLMFNNNIKSKLLATGTAYEKENSTFINKTSYIENCETSAVGRALGMCGFGIDTSVASAEEVQNAMANQNKKETDYRKELIKYCKENNIDMQEIAKEYKLAGRNLSNDDYYDVLCDVKGEKENASSNN